jgi:hypothetical protein
VLREARTELVGQAGAGVLLVDDDRYAASSGREVGGRRHVATETHDHLGVHRGDRGVRRGHGAAERTREPEQVGRRAARHRHLGDEREVVAAGRDQARLEALRRAQRDDPHVGLAPSQAVGKSQQG